MRVRDEMRGCKSVVWAWELARCFTAYTGLMKSNGVQRRVRRTMGCKAMEQLNAFALPGF